MNNDLISREALKKAFTEECCGCCDNCSHCLTGYKCELIDNAPTVNDCPNCEYKLQFDYISSSSSYKELQALRKFKTEHERPQGEFTDLEREVIADSINYLLGAELLEENGYTEEVITALKSVLSKIGADMRGCAE